MNQDLISRQAAIDEVINLWADKPFGNPALVEIKDCIEALPSAQTEHTETHSCDYQHTETHESCTDCPLYDHDRHNCPRFNKVIPRTIEEVKPRWIPVTEALPKNGHYYLKCTKYGNVDVDYYWDGFENATKYGEEIVAWMEKPKPYKEGQDG